jgi:hypothetical protein
MSTDITTIDKDNLEESKQEELNENDDDNGAIEVGTKSIEDPEKDLKDDKIIDVGHDPAAEEDTSSDSKKKRRKIVPVDAPWKERMWESTYRINLFSVTTRINVFVFRGSVVFVAQGLSSDKSILKEIGHYLINEFGIFDLFYSFIQSAKPFFSRSCFHQF